MEQEYAEKQELIIILQIQEDSMDVKELYQEKLVSAKNSGGAY